MDLIKIGKFLSELRHEHDYTQEKLGELLGVSNKTISRWETGKYLPPVEMLQLLSSTYAVSINEILSGERLSPDRYREKAEINLKEAISKSAFSLNDKIAFFKKKWRKEHLFDIIFCVIAVIGLFAAGILLHNKLQIVACIVAFILYVIFYNKMMTYVESHAYDGNSSQ